MENPDKEIIQAVHLMTSAVDATIQAKAVKEFMTPDVEFNHPICMVKPGPNSREKLLDIYQWYRTMSPTVNLKVISHTYDPKNEVIYLNTIQWFHMWWNPIPAQPARFLVRLTLRKNAQTGLYQISKQEDFYQPEDVAQLSLGFFTTPILLAKTAATFACKVGRLAGQMVFGAWAPRV